MFACTTTFFHSTGYRFQINAILQRILATVKMDSSKRAQNARKEIPGSSKQKINRNFPRCNETSANCIANLCDNNKKAETELEISRLQCDALRAVADKWQLELEELRLFSKEELNSKPESVSH